MLCGIQLRRDGTIIYNDLYIDIKMERRKIVSTNIRMFLIINKFNDGGKSALNEMNLWYRVLLKMIYVAVKRSTG
jgi:hypothetical protein